MENSEITVIASEVEIVGNIQIRHDLHLFGKINGEITGLNGSLIHLKENSLVEGKIMGDEIIVDGFVNGDIESTGRVWITPLGKVVGTIKASQLKVDPGAIFQAKVSMK